MSWINRSLSYLDRQNRGVVWAIISLMILGIGALDYLTGFELSFSFFYLLPVSLASWLLGKTPGRIVSLVSAIVWQTANILSGEQLSSPFLLIWNTFTRLGFFWIVSTLLVEFRDRLEYQINLSHTDPLTGALNRRALYEAAGTELRKIERFQRPMTVAFIDLDNFKAINDQFGHITGDAVLISVAGRIKRQMRGTDLVARLGGDEFAVLLPETSRPAAEIVIPRLHSALLDEMARGKWPITFSIGVLTCDRPPLSTQDMFHLADQLMYAAKKAGKNNIEHGSYPKEVK